MSEILETDTFRNWPELDTCGQSNLFHVIAHVISEKSARGPVIRSISRQPMLTLGFTEKVASLLPVCVRFWGDRLVE